jgi:hypothetical protein
MKISLESVFFYTLVFILLCLPVALFIGLCACIFVVFHLFLLVLDQFFPPSQMGAIIVAWLLLLVLYIVLGVLFIRLVARLFRGFFASMERRTRRRIALLSGSPFYALCLLGLLATLFCCVFPDLVNGLTAFVSLLCFVGFALVSGGYLLLLRLFLGRSTPAAQQKQ